MPITVASLDKDLSLAIYSSRGYTSDGRVKPDVAAIGSNIMAPNQGTGTGYTSKSGTSMATPLMAGIVALTLDATPDLTPAEVKDTLVAGATVLAVGTSSVVGGNQVMDKVNKGPEKRRDATVERVMAELAPYIDQRIQQLVPTQTGAVVPTTKAPQIDYRQNVPQRQ